MAGRQQRLLLDNFTPPVIDRELYQKPIIAAEILFCSLLFCSHTHSPFVIPSFPSAAIQNCQRRELNYFLDRLLTTTTTTTSTASTAHIQIPPPIHPYPLFIITSLSMRCDRPSKRPGDLVLLPVCYAAACASFHNDRATFAESTTEILFCCITYNRN
jgi:hypothetical protein